MPFSRNHRTTQLAFEHLKTCDLPSHPAACSMHTNLFLARQHNSHYCTCSRGCYSGPLCSATLTCIPKAHIRQKPWTPVHAYMIDTHSEQSSTVAFPHSWRCSGLNCAAGPSCPAQRPRLLSAANHHQSCKSVSLQLHGGCSCHSCSTWPGI